MALADITTTTGNTYSLVSIEKNKAVRSDLTNGTVLLPKILEISHDPGNASRLTRRMIKLSRAKEHPETGAPRPYSVHIVITMPNDTVVSADLADIVAEMADIVSDTSFMGDFYKGSLG